MNGQGEAGEGERGRGGEEHRLLRGSPPTVRNSALPSSMSLSSSWLLLLLLLLFEPGKNTELMDL